MRLFLAKAANGSSKCLQGLSYRHHNKNQEPIAVGVNLMALSLDAPNGGENSTASSDESCTLGAYSEGRTQRFDFAKPTSTCLFPRGGEELPEVSGGGTLGGMVLEAHAQRRPHAGPEPPRHGPQQRLRGRIAHGV